VQGAKIGRPAPAHGLAAALIFLAASPVVAQDLKSELQRFLHDEAQATVHVRSYYFDRRDPTPPANVALAGGGHIGLQSGWFYDTLQIGAVGYTTQPLWAPQDRVQTSDLTRLLNAAGMASSPWARPMPRCDGTIRCSRPTASRSTSWK
jgi:hypothetical protein